MKPGNKVTKNLNLHWNRQVQAAQLTLIPFGLK